MKLVIVESPGKTQKISQYLGTDYQVVASLGHVRTLAHSGQDHLGISLQKNPPGVVCDYELLEGARSRLKRLKSLARKAEQVLLATDPDREGEAIAWHLAQVLGLKNPQRARFNAITPSAVLAAVNHPQPLDLHLAEAARTRDVLDKILGYQLSPLLWKLNNGAKSAGRCQSAALHWLCQRDREIQKFVPQNYWRVEAQFPGFTADYENELGKTRIFDQAEESQIAQSLQQSQPLIAQIEPTQQSISPPPPLITSTLQQESGKQLGFSSQKTMKLAQQLYEAGKITYHRTDSVQLAPEFTEAVQTWLKRHQPESYGSISQHRNPTSSQAAHEAIRPLEVPCRQVDLSQDCQSLYNLIWRSAIASQCTKAVVEILKVTIQAGEQRLTTQGQRLLKIGYTAFWNNLKAERILPKLVEGQTLALEKVEIVAEQTKPPSQFNEPALVKRLEREGIGRPSTYATIVATLERRGYVKRTDKKLISTQLGLDVDYFLGRVVPTVIAPSFTAQMERTLDRVAQGQQDWQAYICQWYQQEFLPALEQGQKLIETEFRLPPDSVTAYICQFCHQPGLVKQYRHDPRLKVDHWLKCPQCSSPHFWNGENYELPYRLRRRAQSQSANLTEYECPICQAQLERYHYERNAQKQEMLRCSQLSQNECEQVAYFPTPWGWHSQNWGDIITVTTRKINFADFL